MKSHARLVRLVLCALFAAVLCICSSLSIPIGPIPFSMGIFAVMLCSVVLDWKSALTSVFVYLVLGLFLPIFSGGKTGVAAIPYLLMVPIIAWIGGMGRKPIGEVIASVLGCVAAILVCYLCGTVQYSLFAGVGLKKALAVCVIPFAPYDLLKAILASLLGVTLRRILNRMGLQADRPREDD